MNKIVLSMVVATFLTGCSRKENPSFVDKINPKRAELKLVTKQFSGTPPRWKEIFHEGDEIGLYLLADNGTHFYTDSFLYKNVKAKAQKGVDGNLDWKINPPIYLNPNPVILKAYFPYQPQGLSHSEGLFLQVSSQSEYTPDYRYGQSTRKQKRLNSLSPIAHISLKPALVHLSFRVRLKEKVEKDFQLETIQIENERGATLFSRKAILGLTTDRINAIPSATAATRLTVEKARLSTTCFKEYEIRVLPTFRPAALGEIKVLLTINQHTYRIPFPDHTHWKKGYKYVYEIIFDGKVLSLKPVCQAFI